jgi:hypothetical protein
MTATNNPTGEKVLRYPQTSAGLGDREWAQLLHSTSEDGDGPMGKVYQIRSKLAGI